MNKPYRLINLLELSELQLAFEKKLQLWNDHYALLPLSCKVKRRPAPQLPEPREYTQIKDNDQLIALLQTGASIKHHLFNDTSNCFNALSDTLFITLINQLLGTQAPQLEICQNLDDWFYTGSPALALTLNTLTLYLNPQWVLNALPSHDKIQRPIMTISDALEAQPIPLQVELNPVTLRLNDVIHLQAGDVIKTDHPITTPLQLKQNKHPICTVEIGEINTYKSIQITRPS